MCLLSPGEVGYSYSKTDCPCSYLVEAEEVLDGRGHVEDVTFSRHHQHEAAQRLRTTTQHPVSLIKFDLFTDKDEEDIKL